MIWDNRYFEDIGNKSLVMLDGTDMHVQMKFAESFLSHKMKENAVKYEVGVCITTGRIIWIHGPSRAAEHDISVAQQALVPFLDDGKMVVANSGYRGKF